MAALALANLQGADVRIIRRPAHGVEGGGTKRRQENEAGRWLRLQASFPQPLIQGGCVPESSEEAAARDRSRSEDTSDQTRIR